MPDEFCTLLEPLSVLNLKVSERIKPQDVILQLELYNATIAETADTDFQKDDNAQASLLLKIEANFANFSPMGCGFMPWSWDGNRVGQLARTRRRLLRSPSF